MNLLPLPHSSVLRFSTDPLINFDYYSKDIFPKVFLEEDCGRLCQ